MADVKISALTELPGAGAATDELVVNSSGTTYRSTIENITAGLDYATEAQARAGVATGVVMDALQTANAIDELGGDVSGPAISTDSSVAQFDGTTGKLLKDGPAIGPGSGALLRVDGDGSSLTGLSAADQVARDGVATNAAMIAISNDLTSLGLIGGVGNRFLVDDFGADSLNVSTGATYSSGSYQSTAVGSYTQEAAFLSSASPGAQTYLAQSFQVSTTGQVTKFKWRSQNAVGVSLNWTIETDSAGAPSGTLVNASAKSDAVATPAAGTVQEVDLDGGWTPATSTTYWLVCRLTGGGGVPGNTWNYNSSAPYASGTASLSGSAQSYDFVFGIFQQSSVENMTLEPNPVTITTGAQDVLGYFVYDPIDSVALGTDLTASFSIDGGTTDALATLTSLGSLGSTGKILFRAEADVSGQSGTSLVYTLASANNKEMRYTDCIGLIPLY